MPTSDADAGDISEREPLLAKAKSSAASYVEVGASVANAAVPSGADGFADSNGIVKVSPQAEDDGDANGADAEQQRPDDEDGARAAQFMGMPEVRKKMKYILPALSIGIFLAAADQTIVVASAGRMGSDLHSLNNTSWIASAYFLTLTSFQPLYGKLSDTFGRKACLLFAYTIFGLGCLFCGLAGSMEQLIAARALTGVGGGGMTTVVSILMSDIIPLRERGTWQGIVNIIFAAGSGIGAPLGGLLSDSIGWRSAFLGQVPLCILAFLFVLFTLHLPSPSSSSILSKLSAIDFPGAALLILATTSLLLGLDTGSNVSWCSPLSVTCLGLVFPLFVLFVLVEVRYASNPFAPGRIIFDRSMVAAYAVNFFAMAGWFGMLFYVPLYYQAVDSVGASEAGVRLLPAIVCAVTGSLLGGLVIQKTGKYYWLTVGCETVLVVSTIPMVLFAGTVSNSVLGLSIGLALGGLCNGAGITTSLIALISNADPADQAIATACSYLFRSLGSVLGLSVLSAVVQQALRTRLNNALDAIPDVGRPEDVEKIVKNVRESLEYIKELNPQVAVLVRRAYGESIRDGFAVVSGLVAMAGFASFFIREKKLNK